MFELPGARLTAAIEGDDEERAVLGDIILGHERCSFDAVTVRIASMSRRAPRAWLERLASRIRVERLALGGAGSPAKLASLPLVSRASSVTWSGGKPDDAALVALAPRLGNVEELALNQLACGDLGLTALRQASALTRLSMKASSSGRWTAEGLTDLLQCLDLSALRLGDVFTCDLTEVVASGALDDLDELHLEVVEQDGLLELVERPATWSELRIRSVVGIADDVLDALAATPSLTRLRTVELGLHPGQTVDRGIRTRLEARFQVSWS